MIRFTCLVDNHRHADDRLRIEHGLSVHVETAGGSLLFDTGQSGGVLLHNASLLDIPLDRLDALVLSHAHYDHTGGLSSLLDQSHRPLLVYAHPDLFRPRYSIRQGDRVSIGLRYLRADIEHAVDLRLSARPVEVLPGIWTTGEITDRSEFEGRSPNHQILDEDVWRPDPYRDDLSLVIQTAEGLIVLCGCCHAGLLNTLQHVRRVFASPIYAVMGGMHLVSATEENLQQAIHVLQTEYGSPTLFPNHCTGERAIKALVEAFGDRVHAFTAGGRVCFAEPSTSRLQPPITMDGSLP